MQMTIKTWSVLLTRCGWYIRLMCSVKNCLALVTRDSIETTRAQPYHLNLPLYFLYFYLFWRILLAGVPQYGLVVNPQKVVVNFEDYGSTDSCPGVRVLPLRCLFPWCGLLLDTHTLDIYKDYSRWHIPLNDAWMFIFIFCFFMISWRLTDPHSNTFGLCTVSWPL